jgi:hypothetical protein
VKCACAREGVRFDNDIYDGLVGGHSQPRFAPDCDRQAQTHMAKSQ